MSAEQTREEGCLRSLGCDMQHLAEKAIRSANRARTVENIVKYRAMADAYGNAADLLWVEADRAGGLDLESRTRVRRSLGLDDKE